MPVLGTRQRGRGELLELRAADLRFTADEADAFRNHVMGLDLDPVHVAALEKGVTPAGRVVRGYAAPSSGPCSRR